MSPEAGCSGGAYSSAANDFAVHGMVPQSGRSNALHTRGFSTPGVAACDAEERKLSDFARREKEVALSFSRTGELLGNAHSSSGTGSIDGMFISGWPNTALKSRSLKPENMGMGTRRSLFIESNRSCGGKLQLATIRARVGSMNRQCRAAAKFYEQSAMNTLAPAQKF